MKRVNVFQIVLELIVVFGFLVVGTTISTFLIQKVAVDRIAIGLIVMAIGLLGITEFFTLKYVIKIKSIANVIVNALAVVFGVIAIAIKMETSQLCLIWAWFSLGYAAGRITTAVFLLLRQPLLSGVRIILAILMIIFAIFFVFKTISYLYNYLTFLGVACLVEGATLFIEFLIHRYQN